MSQEQCNVTSQCDTSAQGVHNTAGEECCDMPEKLLTLADEAFHDVLKDKLKERILAKKGDTLDKLADLVAETNSQKWAHKVQAKKGCHDYRASLMEIMVSCCTSD